MPPPVLVQLVLRLSAPQPDSTWNREHPYPTHLRSQHALTAAAAVKQVHHIEVELGDSGLQYLPGDTLAVRIENDPALATEVLQLCGLAADGELAHALTTRYELTQAHPGFYKHYAACCTNTALQALVADAKQLRTFMEHRQIVDVLREFPATLTAEQLLSCLRHLQDRQYSIASSQRVTPESVSLTVGLLQFSHDGKPRSGAGSGYLSQRVTATSTLHVYVISNANFRLPEDQAAPVIMVGPGTGIAPFRAFLQERQASGATGRNWLLCGNRHRNEDFLYGDELTAWQKSGLLTRLDLAFSRDQPEKIYVQHLLRQQAAEVFAWLQDGAHLYVCGDAKHMAEDVQKALLALIEQQGRMDAAAARQYLLGLRQQKRYQRDVY